MKTAIITRIALTALILLVVCGYAFAAQTIYVDDNAVGSNNGSSWADAYNYLRDALADANSNSDVNEIRVARGIYKPDQGAGITTGDREATFQLIDGVTVKGGYAGFGNPDPDARDIEAYETILTGDLAGNDVEVTNPRDLLDEPTRAENSYHVVTSSETTDETIVLDGFIVTGGNAEDRGRGGGIYSPHSSTTVTNCTLFANTASWGGGMFIGSGSPTLTNCTFRANAADHHAGAIEVAESYVPITNCTFIGNFAAWNGGAVWNFDAAPPYINCVFSGNIAGDDGGAIWNVDSGGYSFINCTFTNNTAGRQAGAIDSDEWPILTNCIFWGNRDNSGISESAHVHAYYGPPAFNYCCVQGWTGDLGGIGNTGEDPLFVEADGADNVPGTEDDNLRLLAGSSCLDSGDNSALPPSVLTDLDGNPRIINGTVDMGAYEGVNQGFLLSTSSVTVPEGATSQFSVALAMVPAGTVEVTVARQSGDADITVISPSLLIFDSSNYSEPQAVTMAAAQDADYLHGKALIFISAAGFPTSGVTATELDDEAPKILYVDSDATGTGNGTSWADAFAHLQDALIMAAAVPEVEELRVAQGIYKPDKGDEFTPGDREATFQLISGVTLKGGYAGFGEPDPDARDINLYEAILSGDLNGDDIEVTDPCDLFAEPSRAENSWHVVTSEQYTDETAVLDGFTITGGNAGNQEPGNLGGGMYNDWMSNPTLINCTFNSNSAQYGGGIYNDSWSSPKITNCTFIRNLAAGEYAAGGGMATCWGSSSTITNCMFSGNSAQYAGGAVYNRGGYGSAAMTNCTFSDNSAQYGRAFACDSSNSPSNIQVYNSIMWDGGDEIWNNDDSTITITYSDIHGGWPGEGNIDADPRFINPDSADYHLWLNSPCIDTGDNSAVLPSFVTDLDGNPRVIGGRIDMGAYEFCGPVYVDDDAPNDPGPDDPQVSDPLENGTEAHPFDTIQEGINIAKDGYIVLVRQGSYSEPGTGGSIDFLGKNITLTSEDPTDWGIVDSTIVRGYVQFSGTEEPNCTFKGFSIHDLQYGAIYGNHTHATISHCDISGNGPCGATVIKDCDGMISNCLITDNTTVALCGIYPVVFGCNGFIKNCTIANNHSGVSVGTAKIENCIIYNNTGSQLAVTNGNTVDISYSIVQDGLAGIAGDGHINWGPGNIDTDPCFVQLGYWVIDDATLIEGDYHLKSEGWRWNTEGQSWTYDFVTSRCVDAGNPGSPLRDELMSMPRDPNNMWGINLRINMGAYGGTTQAGIPPYDWALLADLNNDGMTNFVDFAYQARDWLTTAPEQPGDLNRDGVLNTMDLALLAQDWLKVTLWIE